MKNNNLILIDFLNTFYRSLHSHLGLEYRGIFTGGLYGFVTQIAFLLDKLSYKDVIICTDKKPYFRNNDYKNYKLRLEKDDDFKKKLSISFDLCNEFLDIIGIPVVGFTGLEADDLIAIFVKRFKNDYDKLIVVSNDSDLYQLFYIDNFCLYKGFKKGFYDVEDFYREFPDIDPIRDWINIISYVGGHNGLPGIKGIGFKTAIRIVKGKDVSEGMSKLLKGTEDQVLFNRRLVKLPYFRFRNWNLIEFPELKSSNYSDRKLMNFLIKYGIKFTPLFMKSFNRLHDSYR